LPSKSASHRGSVWTLAHTDGDCDINKRPAAISRVALKPTRVVSLQRPIVAPSLRVSILVPALENVKQ
jgi:hypothetical protein